MNFDSNDANLMAALEVAVPLRIREYQAAGGPSAEDYGRMNGLRSRPVAGKDEPQPLLGNYAQVLAEKGDILLFADPRKKSGEAAQVFTVFVDALALLSFAPGGVKFMDLRFNASGVC